jgi:hypothetical protein
VHARAIFTDNVDHVRVLTGADLTRLNVLVKTHEMIR